MNETLLIQALVVPAAAGLLCYVAGKRGSWFTRIVALAATAWTLGVCGRVFRSGPLELAPAWLNPWLNVGGLEISLTLKTSVLSGFVGGFVAFFAFLITLYSISFMRHHKYEGRYQALSLWTLAGSLGAVYSDNLLFFLISWEIVTVMLFLLVNLGRGNAPAGAAKSFVILGLSDCAMLLAIVILATWSEVGTLSMSALNVQVGSGFTYTLFILFMIGATAKAGAVPLHTWVPAAADGAPAPVMALLPASLDKLLGIYLLARASLQFFQLDGPMRLVLLIIGAVTIISAVMMAMIQHDLKKLLSFHAVSQVGYMVLGIGTGTVVGIAGGLFHMLNHAIYKSCLFLCAGSVEKATGKTDLDQLGGIARWMPVTFGACMIAALSISGVPPFNGFASKWMVYQGLLAVPTKAGIIFLLAAIFGSALTLASFVKVIHSVFLGQRPKEMRNRGLSESPWPMLVPMIVLAALCVIFGVFVQYPLGRYIIPSLEYMGQIEAGEEIATTTGLWIPGLAAGLVIVGLLVGLLIYLFGRVDKLRIGRSFIGGEMPDVIEGHVSGTGFYHTVRRLPILRTMFRDGEAGASDIYRLGGRFGGTLVQILRRAHTGVLSVYVGWCVVGLIVLVFFLVRVL